MMKAIQVTGYGGVEKLSLVDVPRPIPKAGQVLVQVKACGMNNTEIWMREGAYGVEEASGWKKEGVTFPRIPGSDVAGRIISLGEGVPSRRCGTLSLYFLREGGRGALCRGSFLFRL